MTDHHDFGEHDGFGHDAYDPYEGPEQPAPFDEHAHEHDHGFDDHDELPAAEHHEPAPWEQPPADDPVPDEPAPAAVDGPAGDDPVEVFPPALDVGELPEPVDGFPWIDTASLGAVPAGAGDTGDDVRPEELAEYAGVDLPAGQDPWAALAGDEDPATSTLARWWREN